MVAWNLLKSSQEEIDSRKEDLRIYDIQNSEQINKLKDEIKAAKVQLKSANLSWEQIDSIKTELESMKVELDEKNNGQKDIDKDVKRIQLELSAYKKVYENEKGKRSWTSWSVQIKKEELLKSIGADRGASHG